MTNNVQADRYLSRLQVSFCPLPSPPRHTGGISKSVGLPSTGREASVWDNGEWQATLPTQWTHTQHLRTLGPATAVTATQLLKPDWQSEGNSCIHSEDPKSVQWQNLSTSSSHRDNDLFRGWRSFTRLVTQCFCCHEIVMWEACNVFSYGCAAWLNWPTFTSDHAVIAMISL